ncbi:MAG: hypothetical protein IJZ32_05790 [Clostridia bacterium]|nr:hypothetical protein [Clostridia bacterium]
MKKLVKTLPVIAAVLGLIAIISLFLPAIVVGDNEFLGFTTAFGYEKKGVEYLSFSFMNLLTYLLTIGGTVCAVLTYWKKPNKLFAWISAACLLIAGVFFFFMISFASPTATWKFLGGFENLAKLGYGAIFAGVCCILASVAMIANKLLEK